MNTQIRFLGAGLLVCFIVLFVQLNRIQIFQQDELQANPANNRQIERDFSRDRGSIFTADGVVMATSIEVDDDLQRERTYPEGELYAHSTGYFSFQFGADGLERVYNDELAGQTVEQRFGDLSALFQETDTTANLTTTLNHKVQSVARETLGNRKGSVVAIDPRTGGIIAFWSYPSYDPTVLGSVDLVGAESFWNELRGLPNGDDPRLARMYREIFFPGSTFKVVTASAALDANVATMSDPVFEPADEYVAPLTTVPLKNFGGSTCGGDMLEALRVSCNTVFAELAAEIIGADPMVEVSERFGFNEVPPLDLPAAAASNFPTDYGAQVGETDEDPPVPILENTPALAQAGIGQNDVKATPLQMALVAAGVANGGLMMEPHLMAELRDQKGKLLDDFDPRIWRPVLSSTDAQNMRAAMVTVVERGTATGLQVPGFEIGGKTGTAQVDAERPDDTHAWIIGFGGLPGQTPTVAVAVIVESEPGAGQQTGGRVAAPIARAVLEAALAESG
ncbi:MAG: peptidoglycan D,D-transpeptidase FtsI family protein [Acidimicrobiales bacterium]